MKIAYLLGALVVGGSEVLILDTFKHARREGLSAIGIYRHQGELSSEFKKTGAKLFSLKPKCPFDINYFFELRKTLKSNDITIVHAQQPLDALYAYIACYGSKIKIVLTFHGYDLNLSSFGRKINQFIIKRTDRNIYVSNSQKEYYINKYRLKSTEKQQTVYNGISFEKLNVITENSIRKELNISEDVLLLGTVGSFVAVRDQMTICRFLNLLNKKGVPFYFVFVGRKDDRIPQFYQDCVEYCCEHNLEDKVFFLGSRKDVPAILKELDAFVYSSDHDTFGIAVIEALIKKIPVFVNDWEVMTEVTENGKFATLYKTKDENDLLSKFEYFLKHREEFKKNAITISKEVHNKYAIESYLDALKIAYKKLA